MYKYGEGCQRPPRFIFYCNKSKIMFGGERKWIPGASNDSEFTHDEIGRPLHQPEEEPSNAPEPKPEPQEPEEWIDGEPPIEER